jgi:DNA topoisomerase-2
LLDIKTYQYTKEEVTKLDTLCQQKTVEHNALKGMSVSDLWKQNLNAL